MTSPAVPGHIYRYRVLPTRDCAENRHSSAKYLCCLTGSLSTFPGLSQSWLSVNSPCAPTPPPFTRQLFLDFSAFFFIPCPSILCQHYCRNIPQVIWPVPVRTTLDRLSCDPCGTWTERGTCQQVARGKVGWRYKECTGN